MWGRGIGLSTPEGDLAGTGVGRKPRLDEGMSRLAIDGLRRWGCAMGAVVVGLGCLQAGAVTAGAKVDGWGQAVRARKAFEARRTHSREEYAEVMEGFRGVYHANPGDAHAAQAVGQVAELLVEEGREFGDAHELHEAAGQYEYLAKAYPDAAMAAEALGRALELLRGQAGTEDEAAGVRAELVNDYPRSAAARSLREEVGVDAGRGGSPTSQGRDVGHPVPVVGERVDAGPMAVVSGIRHWSTANYTRVAIDLGADVKYEAARVENPDRIFFDLHHARLGPQLEGKSFAVTDDGFLTRIRAAQFNDDVTRVVLDVHEVTEYSAFLLPNPYRLIIDIHGKPGSEAAQGPVQGSGPRAEGSGPRAQGADGVVVSGVPAPVVRVDGGVSSLPPMPVTDGSAGFGLPARSAAGAAAAQPRVVIASKPTEARPVPNSVATRSGSNRSDVAAVSEQPGKVEATRKPTSRPIAVKQGSGSRGQGSEGDVGEIAPVVVAGKSARTSRGKKAAPVEAAAPTADGETSLVRALGLKIGRIVIDAGHGGHDSGTLGVDGIEEKDVVLDVALRLGKLLHDRLGAEIVYTRADDTYVPLETRTAIANKAQADLFISVHANSSADAEVRGVEVYYLNFTSDPDAMRVAARENAVSTESVHDLSDLVKKIALKDKIDESRELAADVDQSLYAGLEKGNDGLRNRGVKKAPFVVLIGANMPSILAEISFVTNAEDAEELRTGAYRQRVAESLYKGVAEYAAGINGKVAKTVRAER
jgi:N-acetylmuramoyl-L-alanine amidase